MAFSSIYLPKERTRFESRFLPEEKLDGTRRESELEQEELEFDISESSLEQEELERLEQEELERVERERQAGKRLQSQYESQHAQDYGSEIGQDLQSQGLPYPSNLFNPNLSIPDDATPIFSPPLYKKGEDKSLLQKMLDFSASRSTNINDRAVSIASTVSNTAPMQFFGKFDRGTDAAIIDVFENFAQFPWAMYDLVSGKKRTPKRILPEVKTEGAVEDITRMGTGFVSLFIPGLQVTRIPKISRMLTVTIKKYPKLAERLSKVLRTETAAFMASGFGFNPDLPNLSSWLKTLSPEFSRPVFDYLATDPDDNRATNQFRNALEGLGLGVLIESMILGLRAARIFVAAKYSDWKSAKFQKNADELNKLVKDGNPKDLETANQKLTKQLAKQVKEISNQENKAKAAKELQEIRDIRTAFVERQTDEGLAEVDELVKQANQETELAAKAGQLPEETPFSRDTAGSIPAVRGQEVVETVPIPQLPSTGKKAIQVVQSGTETAGKVVGRDDLIGKTTSTKKTTATEPLVKPEGKPVTSKKGESVFAKSERLKKDADAKARAEFEARKTKDTTKKAKPVSGARDLNRELAEIDDLIAKNKKKFNAASPETGARGKIFDEGKALLKKRSNLLQEINKAGIIVKAKSVSKVTKKTEKVSERNARLKKEADAKATAEREARTKKKPGDIGAKAKARKTEQKKTERVIVQESTPKATGKVTTREDLITKGKEKKAAKKRAVTKKKEKLAKNIKAKRTERVVVEETTTQVGSKQGKAESKIGKEGRFGKAATAEELAEINRKNKIDALKEKQTADEARTRRGGKKTTEEVAEIEEAAKVRDAKFEKQPPPRTATESSTIEIVQGSGTKVAKPISKTADKLRGRKKLKAGDEHKFQGKTFIVPDTLAPITVREFEDILRVRDVKPKSLSTQELLRKNKATIAKNKRELKRAEEARKSDAIKRAKRADEGKPVDKRKDTTPKFKAPPEDFTVTKLKILFSKANASEDERLLDIAIKTAKVIVNNDRGKYGKGLVAFARKKMLQGGSGKGKPKSSSGKGKPKSSFFKLGGGKKKGEINAAVASGNFRGEPIMADPFQQRALRRMIQAWGYNIKSVETFDDWDRAARIFGMDVEKLLKFTKNKNNLITQVQVRALGQVINKNMKKLVGTHLELKNVLDKGGRASTIEKLNNEIDILIDQINRGLANRLKGGTAGGRTIAAFRRVGKDILDPTFWMTRALRISNKTLTPEQYATILRDITEIAAKKDPEAMAQYVAMLFDSSKITLATLLLKLGWLTSPTTHMANVTGTASMSLLETISKVPATSIDQMIALGRGLTGRPMLRTTTISLSTVRAKIWAIPKALRVAGKFFKTGMYSDDLVTKYDLPKNVRFDNWLFQTYADGVFRSLGAEDIFFREMAMMESLETQARVIAKNKVALKQIDKSQFKNEVRALLINPDPDMIPNAINAAKFQTFQNKNIPSRMITGLKRGAVNAADIVTDESKIFARLAAAGTEVTAPFVRTPSNVALRIIDFSPVGFLKTLTKLVAASNKLIKQKRALKRGDILPYGTVLEDSLRIQKEFVEDMGRNITGTGVISLGTVLASMGIITGNAPKDPKERQTFFDEGNKPNSIKLFGLVLGLNRSSPVGNLLTLGATFWNKLQENESIATAVVKTIGGGAKAVGDQAFLKGITGVVSAVNDIEGVGGQRYKNQMVASIVPSIIGKIAKGIDPVQRRPESMWESLKTRFFWAGKTVAANRDSLGNVVLVPSGDGENFFFRMATVLASPLPVSKEKLANPVFEKARELNSLIGKPSQTISGIRMTNKEFDIYQRKQGAAVELLLMNLLSSSKFNKLKKSNQKKEWEKAISQARTYGTIKLFPEIMRQRYGLDMQTNPIILKATLQNLSERKSWDRASEKTRKQMVRDAMGQ